MPSRKQYQLHELYGDETPLQRYKRLIVGEGAGLWALIWHELVLGVCTGLPGLIGIAIRNKLYSCVFSGFDRKSYLGKQVILRCPKQVQLGAGVVIDDFAQLIATSRRRDALSIGEGSTLRSFVMVNSGPPEGFVHIGHHTSIGQGTILYGNGGLSIGNKVLIAGQCFIVASSHNYDDPERAIADQGISVSGITIEDNVWIGAGAKILDGVTIGEGAIVGANAVVTTSVAAGARVGGIPARPLASAGQSTA
jgi:acetyltransferase-like isoleucine patch superfamily enzyme